MDKVKNGDALYSIGILWNMGTKYANEIISVEQVWKNIAKNYKINENKIKDIMGFTKNEIIEYLFKGNNKAGNEFITKCQEKENEYLRENGGHIYKNTIRTVVELSNKYDLYIVSNCQSGYIETFWEYYSIKKYFKDYECSGNTGFSKDTNIKMILERNNIAKAVYIGDTIKDYKSANKNGLPFIWAECGFGECNVYHKKISDVSDLLKVDIF